MNFLSTTFNDIFKSSFLSRAVESFSLVDVVLGLVLSTLSGLFIYFIYKKSYSGMLYSRSFNVALLGLSVVTTVVIMAVTSNVVLSLGMVGALSIVRFRSAIKDPMDIVYLFWSIASGIVIGAGLYLIAIIGTAFVGGILLFFGNRLVSDNPYLLIVTCKGGAEEAQLSSLLTGRFKRYVLKSKAVRLDGTVELTFEVRMKNQETSFVNDLSRMEGISGAMLVSYNGEFSS